MTTQYKFEFTTILNNRRIKNRPLRFWLWEGNSHAQAILTGKKQRIYTGGGSWGFWVNSHECTPTGDRRPIAPSIVEHSGYNLSHATCYD